MKMGEVGSRRLSADANHSSVANSTRLPLLEDVKLVASVEPLPLFSNTDGGATLRAGVSFLEGATAILDVGEDVGVSVGSSRSAGPTGIDPFAGFARPSSESTRNMAVAARLSPPPFLTSDSFEFIVLRICLESRLLGIGKNLINDPNWIDQSKKNKNLLGGETQKWFC
jgi:hypothetical protein